VKRRSIRAPLRPRSARTGPQGPGLEPDPEHAARCSQVGGA